MSLRLAQEAIRDLERSRSWYLKESRELLERFDMELSHSLRILSEFPELGSSIDILELRRSVMPVFPFSIFVHVDVNRTMIVAILHHRMDMEERLSDR